MASGRGPRLADLAWLMWGTGSWGPRRANEDCIAAAVNAYRQHIEPTDEELDRLEAVMYNRPLYLVCFSVNGVGSLTVRPEDHCSFIQPPEYFSSTAAATGPLGR